MKTYNIQTKTKESFFMAKTKTSQCRKMLSVDLIKINIIVAKSALLSSPVPRNFVLMCQRPQVTSNKCKMFRLWTTWTRARCRQCALDDCLQVISLAARRNDPLCMSTSCHDGRSASRDGQRLRQMLPVCQLYQEFRICKRCSVFNRSCLYSMSLTFPWNRYQSHSHPFPVQHPISVFSISIP